MKNSTQISQKPQIYADKIRVNPDNPCPFFRAPIAEAEEGKMLIAWLDQTAGQQTDMVGGKAANLSRLAADWPVPPGFCLTTAAFAQWATQHEGESLPTEARELVAASYAQLAERLGVAKPRVAVRSSAVGEDGQTASFAGQYDTYLNLVGADAVIDAVARCWDSARSERVIAYHRQHNKSTSDIRLAVLVQLLVTSDISLVAFSANPVTGDRNDIVINASWGLGESVVSGTVIPDTYNVDKSDLIMIKRTIADKQRMTVMTPDGVEEVAIPRPMRNLAVMSDDQILEVAELARSLETQMGWPVDIEGAYHGDKLYLLQCRPVSTLG